MSITTEAQEIVNGERKHEYGDTVESFRSIAGLWSAYLGVPITSFDVCKLMILLKVSRSKRNNHRDSLIDIVGYIECIDKLLQERHL